MSQLINVQLTTVTFITEITAIIIPITSLISHYTHTIVTLELPLMTWSNGGGRSNVCSKYKNTVGKRERFCKKYRHFVYANYIRTLRKKNGNIVISPVCQSMCGSRGGTGGLDIPPQENRKAIGFLSNTSGDALEKHEDTKPVFNVGPSSALWHFLSPFII